MDYTLDMCSLYHKTIISEKPIVIFDDHNMALPVWGTFASKLKQSLHLVSFDFHADTHDPFAGVVGSHDFQLKKFEKDVLSKIKYTIGNFNFEDVYKLSCDYVINDEHILTAYKFNYINSYHIFCALNEDECLDYERWDRRRGISAFYHTRSHIRNMTDDEIEKLSSSPFILDFDLDYFPSANVFDEIFINKLSLLVQKASIITIAREHDCFEAKKEDENFQNEEALQLLLNVIGSILT